MAAVHCRCSTVLISTTADFSTPYVANHPKIATDPCRRQLLLFQARSTGWAVAGVQLQVVFSYPPPASTSERRLPSARSSAVAGCRPSARLVAPAACLISGSAGDSTPCAVSVAVAAAVVCDRCCPGRCGSGTGGTKRLSASEVSEPPLPPSPPAPWERRGGTLSCPEHCP